jgi:hypothetical protein
MAVRRRGGQTPRDAAEALLGRIEAAEALDGPARVLETALARPAQVLGTPARRLGNALHGTRFGHPIHPLLVTLPIGSWTLAVGLDLLAALGLVRPRPAQQAGRLLCARPRRDAVRRPRLAGHRTAR